MKSRQSDVNVESEIWDCLKSNPAMGLELDNLLEIGGLIWQRGWAEANAGNCSMRIPADFNNCSSSIYQFVRKMLRNQWKQTHQSIDLFLVSAAGSRFREYNKLEFENFVIVIDPTSLSDLDGIAKCNIFPDTRKPTSEWQCHRAIHQWLRMHRSEDKVVLHAHPKEWIILSNLPEYQASKGKMVDRIYQILPEMNIYFPNGISLLPFEKPGSSRLAEITAQAIKDTSFVVWEKHGVLVSAQNVRTAFNRLEIMAKAAAIYWGTR